MRKLSLLVTLMAATLLPVLGQTSSSSSRPKIDNAFVQQQFGKEFTLVEEVGAAYGDLNGDGVEDVVIAARSKNPMLDQGEHDYTVIDPFYDFYGYGNPVVTTTFVEPDPRRRGLMVLVIEGTGPDAWHSDKPKSKFVIVNLPYRTLSIRKMRLRKKTIEAVYIEEAGGTGETSAVFFDGRKFRYVPMGARTDE